MDRLRELRLIIAVDELGSLARAALNLNISLPTASRLLASVERQMGVVLFDRSARRCQPTPVGRSVLERARSVVSEFDGLMSAAEREWSESRGDIRMTAPVEFGRLHVVPAIRDFLVCHPTMNVGLELGDTIDDLQAGDFDLALRIGKISAPSLIARRIGKVRRWTVASPDYLAERGTPSDLDDLHDHTWIHHGAARSVSSSFAAPYGNQKRRATLHPRLIMNDPRSLIEVARAGLGITSVLSYQAWNAVAAGELVVLLEDLEPPPLPVSIVYPEAHRGFQRTKQLVDFLIARFSSLESLRERVPSANSTAVAAE